MNIIEVKNVIYSYDDNRKILNDISINFKKGTIYAILGPSGCGKTTLLSLLGGLDKPTKGKVIVKDKDIAILGLEKHRKENVSFIFQNYNLIDYMNAIENVRLTAKLNAQEILKELNISDDEMKRNVLKLSGGQQQRIAIARALASDNEIILADEPTGNLDEDTSASIIDLLVNAAHTKGKCVIVVTHSRELARHADGVFRLKKGQINYLQV